jgi:predicted SprT family Zn-dependent metalloprotease
MISSQVIAEFFAWAPFVVLAVILVVAYVWTRGEKRLAAPIGKTYSCARCGRRGVREHMVPVTVEGAVVWYCGRCAQTH